MHQNKFISTVILFLLVIFPVLAQSVLCINPNAIDSFNAKRYRCYPDQYHYIDDLYPFCGCNGKIYANDACALNLDGVTTADSVECKCNDVRIKDSTKWHRYVLELNEENYSGYYYPVCGCDSVTYYSQADAYYRGGITKWNIGTCVPCVDTGLIIDPIVHKEFFKQYMSAESIEYVCGCDSVTYRNSKLAILGAGVTKFYKGKCHCKSPEKINTTVVCDSILKPICGCDSITYINACVALNRYGITKYREGPCICRDSSVIDTTNACYDSPGGKYKTACGCDSITYINSCVATKHYGILKTLPGPCYCRDRRLMDTTIVCPNSFSPVCGCDSLTYFNPCIAKNKFGIADLIDRLGPCRCVDANLIVDTIDCLSSQNFSPVCGCNGVSYKNSCEAITKHGITDYTRGPCNGLCIDSIYLDSTIFCSKVSQPVCGCNNITYDNECIARYRFGVTQTTPGKCLSSTSDGNTKYAIIQYPNPTQDKLYIKLDEYTGHKISIHLYESTGKELLHQYLDSKLNEIDVKFLSAGLYITKYYHQNKLVSIKKLSIIR